MAKDKIVNQKIPPADDTSAWPTIPGVNVEKNVQSGQDTLVSPQVTQSSNIQAAPANAYVDPNQLLDALLAQYHLEIVSNPQLLAVSDGSFILKPSYKARYRNG